jgi:hypothetical protein
MKLRENSILEVQTAESGMIIICSEPDCDDYSDEVVSSRKPTYESWL